MPWQLSCHDMWKIDTWSHNDFARNSKPNDLNWINNLYITFVKWAHDSARHPSCEVTHSSNHLISQGPFYKYTVKPLSNMIIFWKKKTRKGKAQSLLVGS